MKNTYDILINLKERAYEFYEWDKNDDIKHIKSIPTFRISSDTLLDFCNNNLIVNKNFLEKIKNKTECFCKGIVRTLDYACILFCDYKAMAFSFSEDGKLSGRSNLLFDEEDDIISSYFELDEIKIDYEIISSCKINGIYTRKEGIKIENLLKYLNSIYENNKSFELKYLYFECFDKEIEDTKKAYKELIEEVKSINFDIIEKLNMLVKVLKR